MASARYLPWHATDKHPQKRRYRGRNANTIEQRKRDPSIAAMLPAAMLTLSYCRMYDDDHMTLAGDKRTAAAAGC